MRPTPRSVSHACLGLCALLIACAGGAERQVERGEELLRAGQARAALESFADAQRDPKLRGLELTRAQVGEARAFLALGELANAQNRLRRLDDTVSAKHYWLAELALREGDRAEAARQFQAAMERAHGGDTALRWAWVVASEATHPDQVADAVRILTRGGERARAQALGELGEVWTGLLRAEPPGPLLERLEAVAPQLADHAALAVLRARLLDALGRREEADAAWDLDRVTPAPSAAFRAHAAALRSRLALEAGDARGLEKALAGADPETAARLRGELAWRRRQNGDLPGALALLRETAAQGGPPAALGAARAAELAAAAGQGALVEELLALAEAAAPAEPELIRRRALGGRVWRGDLLGGADLLGPPASGEDPHAAPDAARQGARLLRAAAQALEAGRLEDAARLTRAARLLAPSDPGAAALAAAAGESGGAAVQARLLRGARGTSQAALDALALRLLLRQGALGEARELLERVGPGQPWVVPTLEAELHGALIAALRGGQGEACRTFLARDPFGGVGSALARLRASAALRSLEAPALIAPRGVPALDREPASGALVAAGTRRWPATGLARGERGWLVVLPGGATLALPDDQALETALGAPPAGLEWWPATVTSGGAPEEGPPALRAPPWSVVPPAAPGGSPAARLSLPEAP